MADGSRGCGRCRGWSPPRDEQQRLDDIGAAIDAIRCYVAAGVRPIEIGEAVRCSAG